MATKTYLELVNDVLTRLREDTVLAVTDNAYSALIGKWVNDAKRMCEDCWDWQALTAAVPVSILASTQNYTLTGLNERARLLRNSLYPYMPMAFDTTVGDPFQLFDRPNNWVIEQRTLLAANPSNQAKPIDFSIQRTAGAMVINLWEVPTGTRSWTLYFIDPQDDLSANGDILTIPYAPVVLTALDMALLERGEEIGEPGTRIEQRALMHIGNAVAIDSLDQPEKVTFYPG